MNTRPRETKWSVGSRTSFELRPFPINFAASHGKEKNTNIKGEIRTETSFGVVEEGAVVLSITVIVLLPRKGSS